MEDQVQGNQLLALILHRSKCQCLVLSYKQLVGTMKRQIEAKLAASAPPAPSTSSPPTDAEQEPWPAVSKFLDTVKRLLGAEGLYAAITSPSEKVQQQNMSLIGPLKAFYQVAQEIERYVDSCRVKSWTTADHRKRWLVEKALNLVLSSDILDLHLHDLLCSYFLVQQAFWGDYLELTCLLEDITCLKSIWLEHDDAADKDFFLSYLSDPFAGSGSIDDFIVRKLSMSTRLETSIDLLPEFLWVDPKDLTADVDNAVIGEGTFGVVSKAHWMGSFFAMKSFFHVQDSEQFGKEASLQARLRHPNVMHLLCCSMEREQKTCSLVMPLMWKDLRALMAIRMENGFNPPFPLPLAVEFMLQIAKGMEYLHSLHIMHRDLKSYNVLVSFPATSQDHLQPMAGKQSAYNSFCLQENLPHFHLRIADFGVSKGKAASSRYSTKEGTIAWMAPEVIEIGLQDLQDANGDVVDATVAQSAKYTKKADVYSFGMVCYEMLTGNFPFEGPRIGNRVLRGERPKLRVGHSCPFALANFIQMCWNQNPLLRPNFTQICRMLRYLKACIMLHDHPRCKMTQLTLQSCSLSGAICDAVDERVKAVEMSFEGLNPKQLRIPLEMFYCSMVVQEEVHNGQKVQYEAAPHVNGQNEEKVIHEAPPSCTSVGAGLPGSYTSLSVFASANTSTLSSTATSSYVMTIDQYKTPEAKLQVAREFSYEELVEATNNFEMEIGSNGKHIEYRGKLQSDQEREIVVKKGRRGDEFSAKELRIVRALEHPHLLPLIGWCWQDEELLHLVYKYMPNGNLSKNILCEDKVMEWDKRYRVVMQLASVLDDMHGCTMALTDAK